MYNKSKSSSTFKEFENKINEHNTFENDWGFYIDIDTNKVLKINNNNNNNNNNFCNKYSTIISIAFFTIIVIIIF
jgi:hypothetical protein